MKKSHIGAIAAVCLIGALTVIVGCSENDVIVADIADSPAGTALNTYFPISDGYTTTYRVTSNGVSELISFEVDGRAAAPHNDMWQFVAELPSGVRDTSYLRVTSQAVYHYDGLQGDPETILQAPLSIGHSWNRFGENSPESEVVYDSVNISLGNLDALLKGNGTVKELNGTDGSDYQPYDDWLAAKVFPTQGRLQIRVQAQEQLNLSNGRHYSYVLRLSNVQQDGRSNYYWYAPGVGLVRYVLGATVTSYPDGDVVGELVEFGTRQ